MHIIYINIIIVTLVLWNGALYIELSTEHEILTQNAFPLSLSHLLMTSDRLQQAIKINLNFKVNPTVDIE